MSNLKNLIHTLQKTITNIKELERYLIISYFKISGISIEHSEYFLSYSSKINDVILVNTINIINKEFKHTKFDVDELITLFELLIPTDKKKITGSVYTPTIIKEYIINSLFTSEKLPLVCDPACGCGSFLISAAKYIHNHHRVSYEQIISNYLYGIDIDEDAIERTKLLLRVLAATSGEELSGNFHLYCGDTLNKNDMFWKILGDIKFDYVIGNPPYVRARNMDPKIKENLVYWQSSCSGNVDLYIVFYEIGLHLLKNSGKLGFISPNTFIQSTNAKSFRQLIEENRCDIKILDFRDIQIFNEVTNYTCIVFLDKSNLSGSILYTRQTEEEQIGNCEYTKYHLPENAEGKPWKLCNSKTDSILRRLESAGKKLGEYKLKNGLATLKNDLFFFHPNYEDDKYYYRTYSGKTYKIEKDICIDVIKPNVIHNENELIEQMEKAIFPYYTNFSESIEIINEYELKKQYPETYSFFKDVRPILYKRDKGHGKYPEWYAYGRTQGLTNFGKKLLLPYMSSYPIAVISKDPTLLFYCGYAIFSDNETELLILKKFLESDAYWYYIKHTSKPYSKGFFGVAKNYIINFSIPKLSKEDISYLLNTNDKISVNNYIWELYGLSPEHFPDNSI